MIVVLHNIRSAHNVGSIFRTADAAGCAGIFLCGITPMPIDQFGRKNSDIEKVALGAQEWLHWKHIKNTPRLLDRFKKQGYTLFVLEQAPSSINYKTVSLSKKEWETSVLVLGAEVDGLPQSLLNRADAILEIPMHGRKESLNVAVAFGTVVFSLRGI